MKKIGIAALILFFLLTVLYAVMQSNIGRNLIRSALTRAIEESGYQVHIDRIEGTLPNYINLKGVAIQKKDLHITISQISLRPVLWRLLKREIAFNDIRAEEVSVSEGAPFNFIGKFRISKKRLLLTGDVGPWSLFLRYHIRTMEAEFTVANDFLIARGNADLLPTFSSNILIRSDPLTGSIQINQMGEEYLAKAVWQLSRFHSVGPVNGTGEAVYREKTVQGTLSAENFAKADFSLKLEPGMLIEGTTELTIENLQSLNIPNTFGSLHAKGLWSVVNQTQLLHLDLDLKDFYYDELFTQNLSLNSDLEDPFGKLKGPIDLSAKNLQWKHLELESATFETKYGEEKSAYKLGAVGSLRHPFELFSTGSWSDSFVIELDTLNGTYIETAFTLDSPIQITSKEEIFRIEQATFTVGDGSAKISIDRQKEDTDASIHLQNIPIDFLSLNPLEIPVKGTLSLDSEIRERNNHLQGTFTAWINQTAPMEAAGQFEGQFGKDHLQLKGELAIHEVPLLAVELSLPIHLSIWPFKGEILYHKNGKGKFAFNGKVEEILEYIDLGPHRLEGSLQGEITFTNTLNRPLVAGSFTFENGFYENYYSGTQLTNIQADILAEKNSLFLRTLTAQDRLGAGAVSANGQIRLVHSDLYPFLFDVAIKNLVFTEIDLVTASAEGDIRIEGNAVSALAKGDIHIHKCELTIPEHIPRPLPHLDVVYRNAIHPVVMPQREYNPYPLKLDLNVTAPTDLTISGRGLTSLWKGNFHLGGTYTSLAAKGNIELIEGEFNFSGRSFKLTEGSLTFSGIEHQMPYLNLGAQTETKGILITAKLKGPLDDPQITLSSNPPLPLGSIMSYLLFGQDISEIGGFQALQIATSLASLAGTGPDVMESTRKNLGVDRLRIVTSPAGGEGGEAVALQVGKYIAKGVLVSFTQGTDESSTNISVEIEMKNNFIFQIESDQRQEQGKFTLKWNLNY